MTSGWRSEFERENADHDWLMYSARIALAVAKEMDAQHITQALLAQKMGCTQQYVSKILKGKENLTLETISKLESVLGVDLIKIGSYTNSYMPSLPSRPAYLNESEPVPYGK